MLEKINQPSAKVAIKELDPNSKASGQSMKDSENSDNSTASPNAQITSHKFDNNIESGGKRIGRRRDGNSLVPLEMKHESVKVLESGSHELQ